MVKKIHLNFRLSYLRDSVIGSIIDDPLTGQFNTVTLAYLSLPWTLTLLGDLLE